MEKALKFLSTMSVADFKSQQNVDQIEIKRNDQTGKYFFIFGLDTGAVSIRAASEGLVTPVISKVCSANSGEIFFLLHQKGENKATTVCTL